MEKNNSNIISTSNNINNESSKYKKLINNCKDNKAGNRIVKLLATASLADIIQVNKWWEQSVATSADEEEERWKALEHNGVLFPPRYEAHGVKIKYRGQELELDPLQEELATFWAGILDNDLSTKEITRKNFFKEFKKSLGERYALSILEDFDFYPIHDHILKIRERNKNKSTEEKKMDKKID